MLGNIDEDTYYSKQCHEINEQSFVCLCFDLSVTKNSHNSLLNWSSDETLHSLT